MIDRDTIETVYAAFNQRDIDAVLSFMSPDVDWPNGMEGGRVHGHAAVRDYWTRQWQTIDPRVTPTRIQPGAAGEMIVDVHQIVRDLSGQLLADRMVRHVYELRDGLIVRMLIEDVA